MMYVPPVGDRPPPWGNRFTRAAGRFILRLTGWRFEGEVPDVEKAVYVVAPHTTGWDFPIGVFAVMAIGIEPHYLGVDWMFKYPFTRALGGIPVDRSRAGTVVDQVVEQFNRHDKYVLGMSPEGSRKKVVPWKTGFYRIAMGAGASLVLVAFDPKAKLIRLGQCFTPSGDFDQDMDELIRPFYAEYLEKYPEQFGM